MADSEKFTKIGGSDAYGTSGSRARARSSLSRASRSKPGWNSSRPDKVSVREEKTRLSLNYSQARRTPSKKPTASVVALPKVANIPSGRPSDLAASFRAQSTKNKQQTRQISATHAQQSPSTRRRLSPLKNAPPPPGFSSVESSPAKTPHKAPFARKQPELRQERTLRREARTGKSAQRGLFQPAPPAHSPTSARPKRTTTGIRASRTSTARPDPPDRNVISDSEARILLTRASKERTKENDFIDTLASIALKRRQSRQYNQPQDAPFIEAKATGRRTQISITKVPCLNTVRADNGDTLLHAAARAKNYSLVLQMLVWGANPTLQNQDGDTVLDILLQTPVQEWVIKTPNYPKVMEEGSKYKLALWYDCCASVIGQSQFAGSAWPNQTQSLAEVHARLLYYTSQSAPEQHYHCNLELSLCHDMAKSRQINPLQRDGAWLQNANGSLIHNCFIHTMSDTFKEIQLVCQVENWAKEAPFLPQLFKADVPCQAANRNPIPVFESDAGEGETTIVTREPGTYGVIPLELAALLEHEASGHPFLKAVLATYAHKDMASQDDRSHLERAFRAAAYYGQYSAIEQLLRHDACHEMREEERPKALQFAKAGLQKHVIEIWEQGDPSSDDALSAMTARETAYNKTIALLSDRSEQYVASETKQAIAAAKEKKTLIIEPVESPSPVASPPAPPPPEERQKQSPPPLEMSTSALASTAVATPVDSGDEDAGALGSDEEHSQSELPTREIVVPREVTVTTRSASLLDFARFKPPSPISSTGTARMEHVSDAGQNRRSPDEIRAVTTPVAAKRATDEASHTTNTVHPLLRPSRKIHLPPDKFVDGFKIPPDAHKN